MTIDADRMQSMIEDAVLGACEDYNHPQATSSVSDAVEEILLAMDAHCGDPLANQIIELWDKIKLENPRDQWDHPEFERLVDLMRERSEAEAPARKVHLLLHRIDYEGDAVEGVFITRAAAEAVRNPDRLIGVEVIEEWEIKG